MAEVRLANEALDRGGKLADESEESLYSRDALLRDSPDLRRDGLGAELSRPWRLAFGAEVEERAKPLSTVEVKMDTAFVELGAEQRGDSTIDLLDAAKVDVDRLGVVRGLVESDDDLFCLTHAETPRQANAEIRSLDPPR
jgi:hypothetical protein